MTTILTLDIGNTAVKISVYKNTRLCDMIAGKDLSIGQVRKFIEDHPEVDAAVCCRVGDDRLGVIEMLDNEIRFPVLKIDKDTPVPIQVDYSRETMGNDRLAAAVGVAEPDRNVLIVDAGTAVTLDMTCGMRYIGGNISPGLYLRFESLRRFTCQLPMVEAEGPAPLFGHTTDQAIRSGVERGLAYEVAETYRRSRELYGDVSLVLTGGNAGMLSRHLTIMNVPHSIDREAVGRGLVRIYNYINDSNDQNR